MSLKAGRVGVNPADVDPVDGHIKSDATSGYTKQEADAKFETQTHAASTYETKSDAAGLQSKTLTVPINMLIGSQIAPMTTVEDVLSTMNNGKSTAELTKDVSSETKVITSVHEKVTVDSNVNKAVRFGKVISFTVRFTVLDGISSGAIEILDTGFFINNDLLYPYLTIFDRSAPFAPKTTLAAYIDGKQIKINGSLVAGTYEICGTYICQ